MFPEEPSKLDRTTPRTQSQHAENKSSRAGFEPDKSAETLPTPSELEFGECGIKRIEIDIIQANPRVSHLEGCNGWVVNAFEHVEIDSVFTEPDTDGPLQRKFVFDDNYDPDNALPVSAARSGLGTVVRLIGYREPYKSQCPKTADLIAQRLIEHFLLIFLEPDCPQVEIHDLGQRLLVNKLFETDLSRQRLFTNFRSKGLNSRCAVSE